jgi:hypothetical protein
MRVQFITLKKASVCLLFAVVSLLVLRGLLLQPGVIGYGRDWPFPPYAGQYVKWGPQEVSPYIDYAGGFPATAPSYWIPVLFYPFGLMGIGGDIISKLTVFLALFGSGLSLYYLAHNLGLRRPSSFIAGLFYMLLPTVFGALLFGHIVYLISYALSPLVLALFIKSSRSPSASYKTIILAGLIYGLAWAQGQFVFMLFGLLLLYTLFAINLRPSERSIQSSQSGRTHVFLAGVLRWASVFKTRIILFLIVNLIAVLIQLPWLLQVFYTPRDLATLASTTAVSFLNRFTGLSSTLTNAFVLTSYYGWTSFISNIVGYVFVIIATLALLVKHKNRTLKYFSLYFGLFMLISLFIVTGANSPLGNLKIWILLNVPLGRILEDPFHFSFMLCLSYAMLFAIFNDYLMDKLSNANVKLVITTHRHVPASNGFPKIRSINLFAFKGKLLISVSLLILLFVSTLPFFTGLNGEVQVYNPPTYYKEAYDYFANMPGDFRVSWLPMSSVGNLENSSIQPVRDPIVTSFSKPGLDVATFRWHKYFAFMARTIGENRTKYFGQLLGVTNVKDVITRNDFVPHYAQTSLLQSFNQTALIAGQEGISWVKNFGALDVFENNLFLPHVYGASKAVLVAGDLSSLITLGYYFGNQTLPLTIFSSQLSPTDNSALEGVSTIVIQDNDYTDLLLPFIPSEYRVQPASYATSQVWDAGWTQSYTAIGSANWGYYTQLEDVIISATNDTLAIPFNAPASTQYKILAKVFFGSMASTITFSIDGKSFAVNANTPYDEGFKWIELGLDSISEGSHSLTISSDKGQNAVGLAVIVPENVLSEAETSAYRLTETKPVILMSKPQNVAKENNLIISSPGGNMMSEGEALQALQPTTINFSVWAPYSGSYALKVRGNLGSELGYMSIDNFENVSVWYNDAGSTAVIEQSTGDLSGLSYSFVINKTGDENFLLGKDLPHEDWRQYNTIGFWIYPQADITTGTAFTFFSLRNGDNQWYSSSYSVPTNKWSYVTVDVSNWTRDAVSKIRLASVGSVWGQYADGLHVKLVFRQLSVFETRHNTELSWQPFGNFTLSRGWNYLTLNLNTPGALLDLFALEPSEQHVNWEPMFPNHEVSYEKISSTEYRVYVNSSKPVFIVFSENYDPSWVVELNGQTLGPLPTQAYGFGNLYYVNMSGQFTASLQYALSQRYTLAISVTSVTFVTCLILLLIPAKWAIKSLRRWTCLVKRIKRNEV